MTSGLPTISARYRIDREIGRGGMGAVYLGMDTLLNRAIAIKLLSGGGLHAPSAVARFVQEGRVCAQLRSDNCVEIFDLGVTEQGQPYLVMELLKGRDVAAELQRGPIVYTRAASYVAQACNAIAEAHALGIVHRDLKPHNLFLSVGSHGVETLKVLDFGISRLPQGTPAAALTAQGELLGTPAYMSPEQISGRGEVDGRSDIWALGVILYELVGGVTPFSGDTLAQHVYRILHEDMRPLRDVAPSVPAAYEAIVRRCLQRDVNARYPNVTELMRDLAKVVQAAGSGSIKDDTGALAFRATDLAQPVVSMQPSLTPASGQSGPAINMYDSRNNASLGSFSHTPPVGSLRRTSESGILGVVGLLGLGFVALVGIGVAGFVLYHRDEGVHPPSSAARGDRSGAPSVGMKAVPTGPIVWSAAYRNAGGFAVPYLKANTEEQILACVRSNEPGLRDAYSPSDLKQGFGVTMSYDAAGTVTAVTADSLPNIASWMQLCLNSSLLGKSLGPPPFAAKQRDIYVYVTGG